MIAFPTSMGRYFDWENRGLVRAIGEHLYNGWLQLYCIDSVDSESWYDRGKHPADRIARHQLYDDYLVNEVIPFSHIKNANPFLITTGASFGGYHALNFGLKHADLTGRILSMSGLADVKSFADGYYDQTLYFNNPRDLTIPHSLLRACGHTDCGIYAEVIAGGTIAPGDPIDALDEG